jgi:hypothetical protein
VPGSFVLSTVACARGLTFAADAADSITGRTPSWRPDLQLRHSVDLVTETSSGRGYVSRVERQCRCATHPDARTSDGRASNANGRVITAADRRRLTAENHISRAVPSSMSPYAVATLYCMKRKDRSAVELRMLIEIYDFISCVL